MKSYEQRYGTLPDGFLDAETPPEDWQFENPLVTVSKDGVVKNRLQKSFARPKAEPPKMRPISEILNKEVENVTFLSLPMDKQIKMVAEEHNKGLGPTEIQRKLGIKGAGTYYDRLRRAKEMGLVAEPEDKTAAQLDEPVMDAPGGSPDATMAPTICPEFFREQAEYKRQRAASLAEGAERLEQAGVIATALADLLGDDASDLINGLYVRVS